MSLMIILLSLGSLCGIMSIYLFFDLNRLKPALVLLFLAAFLLRLAMAMADPYLHPWDERFHVLVAKNMISNPIMPMLYTNPVMPYDPGMWCCNHIWLHKQPLFMWFMAGSMKLFGTNEFAARIPSALLNALQILLVFDIARIWLGDKRTAFLAAIISAFSFYSLELVSGRFGLDHNDLHFAFFVLASVWAFVRLTRAKKRLNWVLLVGLFAGFAILNKWLTGILVFGGWGLYILLDDQERRKISNYTHIAIAAFVCCVVFIPWQWYAFYNYPIEYLAMQASNNKHITEVLDDQGGSVFYHVIQTIKALNLMITVLLIPGLFFLYRQVKSQKLTIPLIAMTAVVYLFFSLVSTKMPAFTYIVHPILIIMAAAGLNMLLTKLNQQSGSKKHMNIVLPVVLILIMYTGLQPHRIIKHRADSNTSRNELIQRTELYKSLHFETPESSVVINLPVMEHVNFMFYQGVSAYQWYPKASTIDSLQQQGLIIYSLADHGNQYLPDYIRNNDEITIIDWK